MRTLIALLAAMAMLLAAAPASGDDRPAQLTVVHGINGTDLGADVSLPVDVAVDGACALTGLEFKQFAGPLELPAGTYQVAISLADPTNPCGNDPVITAPLPLRAGRSASAVAHLDGDGAPTASLWHDDFRRLSRRVGGADVRHGAAAPAVDLWANFRRYSLRVIGDLENGEQAQRRLLAGTYEVGLAAADGGHWIRRSSQVEFLPGFESIPLPVEGRQVTTIYAFGTLGSTFELVPAAALTPYS